MIPLLLSAAYGQGLGADVELVRPTFSESAAFVGDSARLPRAGSLRVGALTQYERDTLLLYQYQTEVGAVIANRQTLTLGLAWQPVNRLSLRASLPVAGQWGSEVQGLGGDGFGVGDLAVGVRVAMLDRRVLGLAASADLYMPTGDPDLWLGEGALRADAAVLGDVDFGPVGLRARLGTVLRPPIETEYDLAIGSEVGASAAVVYELLPDRARLSTGIVTRTSYAQFFQAGESVAEWVSGGNVRVLPRWWLDVGLGRGLSAGYGTSQVRVLAGLTWEYEPPPPKPAPPRQELVVTELTPDLTEAEVEPTPEPPPDLAYVVQDQIVIRDPIQFEFGTDRILPISQPTLEAIAGVLESHPEILHVVIEGHASEEGSYTYNYTLSLSRALSIFKALVDEGVHPARISCRAMGEVVPLSTATDEASLAANRRVVFHIVRRLQPGEPWPDYGATVTVPWSGETRPVPPPPPPLAPAPDPTPAPVLPPPDDVPDFRDDLEESE